MEASAMRSRGTDSVASSAGKALVELAITLPLIVLIALSAIEYSISFSYMQASIVLSREVASIAFRGAATMSTSATYWGDGTGVIPVKVQLTDLRDKLQSRIAPSFPGAELMVSLYVYDEAAGTWLRAVSTRGSQHSRYRLDATGSRIEGRDVDSDVLRRQRAIVVGEAFIPAPAYFSAFWGTNGFEGRIFYASTII
jgi:hypothetical protein